ncbi:MAG TPA: hypothetical protein EYN66_20470 [Myxococcales bacterium]|nr:hypothetical protein [Myxococcales bacterium]
MTQYVKKCSNGMSGAGRQIAWVVMGALACGFILFGLQACTCQAEQDKAVLAKLVGQWKCETSWSYDKDGVSVPCSATSEVVCKENGQSVASGTVSLGDAEWSDSDEAKHTVNGKKICVTRTMLKTVPNNDAARQFEKTMLAGKSLSSIKTENDMTSCVEIISFSQNELKTTNDHQTTTTCTRL